MRTAPVTDWLLTMNLQDELSRGSIAWAAISCRRRQWSSILRRFSPPRRSPAHLLRRQLSLREISSCSSTRRSFSGRKPQSHAHRGEWRSCPERVCAAAARTWRGARTNARRWQTGPWSARARAVSRLRVEYRGLLPASDVCVSSSRSEVPAVSTSWRLMACGLPRCWTNVKGNEIWFAPRERRAVILMTTGSVSAARFGSQLSRRYAA